MRFLRQLFYGLFLLLIFHAHAQTTARIDSLYSVLHGLKEKDTNYILLLYAIGDQYTQINPEKAFEIGKETLELSEEVKFSRGIAKSLNLMGISYCFRGKFAEGRGYFLKYVKLAAAFKGREYDVANGYDNIGNTYYYEGNFDQALNYYFTSLKSMERLNHPAGIANVCGNLGNVYRDMKRFKEANSYYERSYALSKKMGDERGAAINLHNMASLQGTHFNNPQKAIEYFNEAIALLRKNENTYDLGVSLSGLAENYNQVRKYKEALATSKEAEKYLAMVGDSSRLAQSFSETGVAYMHLGASQLALMYFERALATARSTNMQAVETEALQRLAELYHTSGNDDKAYSYSQLYSHAMDSLYTLQSNEKMAEMQTKYETEKKERENKLLQEKNENASKIIRQQRYFAIAVGFICVMLVVFALVIFRSNKQKQRVNLELARKNAMIEKQKQLVEEKQKEILDSIHYAKRIQGSLLTSEKYTGRTLIKLRGINSAPSSES